ncbi:MAG TPA: PPC domain-containing DNA-binding protein [Bryobacteraceae bacterium]|nr:PPC domain-containing DNA-binding protein [Bryobacteraceae bacterium]
MQARTIDNQPDTYAVIFETGDEVAAGLAAFAQQHHLTASHFSAIGGFEDVTLGYFDWSKKEYTRIPLTEQVEVLSLIGDIALDQEMPKVHAHVIVGKSDGSAHGGHLLEAHVRPTLEVMVVESAGELRKSYDPLSKLNLIKT